ncbi:uncharacterized protein EV154DRAFT_554525 [Mucor mucedo]|uniref:uncharacterized protein n=1 Tax=Mucor mucedo TaxID=29922 RepID=UPI00221FC287|nr:uncharacterized protein EV154DRAFT_554525 [Mucor mucedo]KAI7887626.1 hypothetical protein EV154DRAFT_554525 [Mucor mucedo]
MKTDESYISHNEVLQLPLLRTTIAPEYCATRYAHHFQISGSFRIGYLLAIPKSWIFQEALLHALEINQMVIAFTIVLLTLTVSVSKLFSRAKFLIKLVAISLMAFNLFPAVFRRDSVCLSHTVYRNPQNLDLNFGWSLTKEISIKRKETYRIRKQSPYHLHLLPFFYSTPCEETFNLIHILEITPFWPKSLLYSPASIPQTVYSRHICLFLLVPLLLFSTLFSYFLSSSYSQAKAYLYFLVYYTLIHKVCSMCRIHLPSRVILLIQPTAIAYNSKLSFGDPFPKIMVSIMRINWSSVAVISFLISISSCWFYYHGINPLV